MARVTTEDCIDKVPNRFDLVLLAAYRAKEISTGEDPTVDRDNDKNPVVALREIAEETQAADLLRERTISSLQSQNEIDEPDDDEIALLTRNFSQGVSASAIPFIPAPVNIDADPEVARKMNEDELRKLIDQTRGEADA